MIENINSILLIVIIPLLIGITGSLIAAHIDRYLSAKTASRSVVEKIGDVPQKITAKKNKSRIKAILLIVIIPLLIGITGSLIAAHIDRYFSAKTASRSVVEAPVHIPEGSMTEKYTFKVIIEKNTQFVKPENQALD